ncbi:MAG TPA: class I SAM-dependent methyltransferase [Rhodopila sp.]
MLPAAVPNLIERSSHHASVAEIASLVASRACDELATDKAEPRTGAVWPPERLAVAHLLWGDGFIFPGGEIETLRLARPLGASAATSLLIVGIGSGGSAAAIARNLGTWVTGMESDQDLIAAASKLVAKAKLGKKVNVVTWDPENPSFDPRSHHHCLAIEPLLGSQPEPILDGLARALRPGGQLVLTELACAAPLNRSDPTVEHWASLEQRDPAEIPTGIAVTRMLGRVGLDVRIAEDISARHLQQAMLGWRLLLRDLQAEKPTRQQAVRLVEEAELWLLRCRLIREGRLRMMRWHAISRSAPV